MAKKDSGNGGKAEETTTTALAQGGSSSAMTATSPESDALAQVLDGVDVGDGGLGEIDKSDFKLAAKVFNFKGTDAAGDPIPPNVFYDTVEETAKKVLDLAFLLLHKTNEWREYDEAEGRSKIRCRSADRVMGIMEDGTERRCEGCPDAQWRTTETKKRTRNCGPVYNVVAMDRETQQPCVVRFKRTSLPVIQSHLQKHHIGKRILGPGQRGNVPFFSFQVRASLKMSDDKKYAIPVLEKGSVLSQDEIRTHADSVAFFREHVLAIVERVAEKDTDTGGGGGAGGDDSSFDFGANAAPAGGDRFADDRMR